MNAAVLGPHKPLTLGAFTGDAITGWVVTRARFSRWAAKYWVGVNGAQTLSWVLPKEFTEAETRAPAKQIELKWKGPRMIVEGVRLEFGPVPHRDGLYDIGFPAVWC